MIQLGKRPKNRTHLEEDYLVWFLILWFINEKRF